MCPATLKLVTDDWDAELHAVHHVTRGPADWPTKAVGSSRICSGGEPSLCSRPAERGTAAVLLLVAQQPHLFGVGENVHRGGHMKL